MTRKKGYGMSPEEASDNVDLFYIDESSLDSSDEDEFLSLYESGMRPDEVVNPDFRKLYREFLENNGYAFDD